MVDSHQPPLREPGRAARVVVVPHAEGLDARAGDTRTGQTHAGQTHAGDTRAGQTRAGHAHALGAAESYALEGLAQLKAQVRGLRQSFADCQRALDAQLAARGLDPAEAIAAFERAPASVRQQAEEAVQAQLVSLGHAALLDLPRDWAALAPPTAAAHAEPSQPSPSATSSRLMVGRLGARI